MAVQTHWPYLRHLRENYCYLGIYNSYLDFLFFLPSTLIVRLDYHSRIPMLRARGASLSEHRDAIVKLCRQLQGKNLFKMSTSDIRALVIKSLSCDDARERILSFRDDLAGSCMEEILQVRPFRHIIHRLALYIPCLIPDFGRYIA